MDRFDEMEKMENIENINHNRLNQAFKVQSVFNRLFGSNYTMYDSINNIFVCFVLFIILLTILVVSHAKNLQLSAFDPTLDTHVKLL